MMLNIGLGFFIYLLDNNIEIIEIKHLVKFCETPNVIILPLHQSVFSLLMPHQTIHYKKNFNTTKPDTSCSQLRCSYVFPLPASHYSFQRSE